MDFTLPDKTRVHLVGDPHIGKRFEVGVPFNRRGERETNQQAHFIRELDAQADVIILVGDIFDHPFVSYSIVDFVAKALLSAAERNPDVLYVVMAGNHDVPRNISSVGAFHDLQARLQDRAENLVLSRSPAVYAGVAIFPWEWERGATEQVQDLQGETPFAAVGHWNPVKWTDDDPHLVPVAALAKAFGNIPLYTGHLHKAGTYKVAGRDVECVGSMEPYAHDQDADGSFYVTLDRAAALADPEALRNKHVRVLLAPGEDLPALDALAVIPYRKVVTDEGQSSGVTLSLSNFDWNAILAQRINPLDPIVKAFIKERLPYDESAEQRGGSDQAVRHSSAEGDSSEDRSELDPAV